MSDEFDMENVAVEQPWSSSYTYQVSRHSVEMLHNLNAQRKDGGRLCDVVLRVGEESFPAHKAVLAACSEYFESVFSHPPEGDAKELEMHTISPKVFRDILDFAYTSKIVIRLECFPELMTAAKFLVLRSVVEICQEVIKHSNVQILVPTSRGGEASLFQATEASELGLQLAQHDMVNGTGAMANGLPLENNGHVDGDQGAGESSAADVRPVEAVSATPSSEVSGSPLHDASSPGSKRNRGRPKKATAKEPADLNDITAKNNGLFPCGSCGKAFTEASRLKHHDAQHGASSAVRNHAAGSLSPGGDARGIPPAGFTGNCAVSHGGGTPESNRKRERIRRHVGCDVCGKVFRDVYHLNRHKLSHSGEKPYECLVCGLRFKRKDRMSYHVRSHDGSVGKPYVCQSCGKGFSR